MVQGWAERTPPGFVMHVKAFGLMTRHPVRLEQVPPDLREGMPVDERGRVDRPPRELRGRGVPGVPRRARAAALGGQARRDPLPAAAVRRLEAVVARLPRMGARPARRRPHAGRVPARVVVRGGRRRQGAALARGARHGLRGRRRAALGCEERPAHGRRGDGADGLRPLPRPQRGDVEQARRRRGRALRLHLRRGRAARVGRPAARAGRSVRGGLRVLQQQQPDERRRPGAGRRGSCCGSCWRRNRCPVA